MLKKMMLGVMFFISQITFVAKAMEQKIEEEVHSRWMRYGDIQLVWDHKDHPIRRPAIVAFIDADVRRSSNPNKKLDEWLQMTQYPEARDLAVVLRCMGAKCDRDGRKAEQKRQQRQRELAEKAKTKERDLELSLAMKARQEEDRPRAQKEEQGAKAKLGPHVSRDQEMVGDDSCVIL